MTNGKLSPTLNPVKGGGGFTQQDIDDATAAGYADGLAEGQSYIPQGWIEDSLILTLTLPSSVTTKTFKLPRQFAQSMSTCWLLPMGYPGSDYSTANPARSLVAPNLASDDTITLTRGDSATGNSLQCTVQLVKWNSVLINAVYEKTITVSADTSATSSTSDAVLARCVPILAGFYTTSTSAAWGRWMTTIKLSGSDGAVSLTAEKGISTDSVTAVGYIVEFKAAAYTSIQQATVTIGTSTTTGTATINSVTPARTALFYNGCRTAGTSTTNLQNYASKAVLTDATTITGTRYNSDATFTVVQEFCVLEGDATHVENAETLATILTSATDREASVSFATAVTKPNLAILINGGWHYEGATIDLDLSDQGVMCHINNDALMVTRFTAGIGTVRHRFRLLEGKY